MSRMQEVINYLSTTDKPVQLVKHIAEVPASKLMWPAQAEVKEDGVYCMVVCTDGLTVLFSRTGKPFYYDGIHTLNMPMRQDGWVYITELINPAMSLEELSGLVNPNRVTPWTVEQRASMHMNARLKYHDVITVHDLLAGYSLQPFSIRRRFLHEHVPEMYIVQSKEVHSMEEFEKYSEKLIERGEEGAVLKQLHAQWTAGHKGWHVTKQVRGLHVDLRCTNVKYGKPGKHQHWIAALEFEYKGKKFWADLGKGWDNERRDYLTKGYEHNRLNVIGQIFHVKALQESSKGVLRLPKVAEQRVDKEDADQ